MDVSCSGFYECIRDAYELAESISDVLSLIIDMDSGDAKATTKTIDKKEKTQRKK